MNQLKLVLLRDKIQCIARSRESASPLAAEIPIRNRWQNVQRILAGFLGDTIENQGICVCMCNGMLAVIRKRRFLDIRRVGRWLGGV